MQHNQIPLQMTIEDVMQIKSLSTLQEPDLNPALAAYINELILTNFERLVQLLYRIDVSEEKLKKLLRQNPESDAGVIIASLIIERQKQKIAFQANNTTDFQCDGCEEEML